MTKQQRTKIALSIGLLCLVALPPVMLFLDQIYFVSLFSRVLIYALAAVSLDLLLGFPYNSEHQQKLHELALKTAQS